MTGSHRGGGGDPGFAVKETVQVTRFYCPECHRPLPKSQQSSAPLSGGEADKRNMFLIMMSCVVAVVILILVR